MKGRKILAVLMLLLLEAIALPACGKQEKEKLANELVFSLEGVRDLCISYDDETVTFFKGEDESLVIREYMNRDKKSYHARVRETEGSIEISEGGKPFFKGGFLRYVEVYLPESYSENLTVTTTDGTIDMSAVELDLNLLRVDSTSGSFNLNRASAETLFFSSTRGKLQLGSIAGEQIRIETTQGEVSCEEVRGNVTYTSTSGNGEFASAWGWGTYRAENSGRLSVTYVEVTDDLSFYNKNDDLEIVLPGELSFAFEAVTKNGAVDTDFQGELSAEDETITGRIGSSPSVTVRAETKNGNIEVRRRP